MRTSQLLTCLLLVGPLEAQLINGSFENGSNGWTVPCDCAPAFLSPDGAPGGGAQCIALQNAHLDCGCMLFHVTQQSTPWVTPGSWTLSGWIKSAVPGDEPGSRISFSAGSPFSTPGAVDLWSSAGTWEFKTSTFAVEDFINTDSLRISLIPDDGNEQEPTLCYFDNIQLTPEVNTGLTSERTRTLSFRPNPATDKLWVDLPEAPISVIAIDATGRSHALQNFQHTGRTLELDVSRLPSGMNLLRVVTPSGNHIIRSIKA